MSNNKDKDNLSSPEENYLDHCNNALNAQMRQTEQAILAAKAQQATQSKDKPKETKK
jgi:hypothetical protein